MHCQPTTRSVTLRDGIDMAELQRGGGVEFEVDLSAPLPGGGWEESSPDDEEEDMDRESLLQQLNVDSLGLGREEESDSDQEVKR